MKRQGGKPMSQSMMHRMFSNIFYAGYFYDDKGELRKGEHQPMITLEEFDLAQKFFGENGKPRPKKHIHSYTGFIKCAECRCSVTGEKKLKFIKKTGEYKYYTYYHCTWKSLGTNALKRNPLKNQRWIRKFTECSKKLRSVKNSKNGDFNISTVITRQKLLRKIQFSGHKEKHLKTV